jgi:Ca2+-binding RTX toxin-like protein
VATILVNSTAGLTSALKAAHGGDVIKLAPGTYSDFSIGNLKFGTGVTVTSLDPTNPAKITDFLVSGVQGLKFQNLEMVALDHADYIAKGISFYAFKVAKSSDVTFDKINFHGSLDGNAQNDVLGLQIRDSSNVAVTNSEFQQFNRALAVGNTKGVVVTGNDVHDLRSDGFNFAQVNNVKISANTFHDFDPVKGDHPDAIQFWTNSTTTASTDIVISGNVIMRGEGEYTQGIFIRDEVGTLPYERLTITDNLIVGTGWSGLRVQGAKDLTVTNNELVSLKGDYVTWMLIQNATNVVATGNSAAQISFDNSTNVVQNNKITTAVTDLGLKAINDWMGSHTLSTGMIEDINEALVETKAIVAAMAPPPVDELLTGTVKSDLIQGFDGNDTLDGKGGTDTLAGGTGDDVYMLPNGASTFIENAGEGTDTIIGIGSFVLPKNIENLVIYEDARGWKGTGNELNNVITGNSAANALTGMDGADTLNGGGGADTLIGGTGADRLIGGDGDDTFRFTPGGGQDVITDFGSGAGQETLDIYAYTLAGLTPKVIDVGGNAVISFTNGDSITLIGHTAAELGAVSKYGWVF